MSFTTDVKAEICANELHDCCRKAEAAALVQMCSTWNFTSEGMHLKIQTENANTAKRIWKLLREMFHVDAQLSVLRKMKLKKKTIFM